MRFRSVVLSLVASLLLLASSIGCVFKSQYEMLQAQNQQMQARLNDIEQRTGVERTSMRQQIDNYSSQAVSAQTEVQQCRVQQAEVRAKLEQAMPLLNHILSSLAPAPTMLPPVSSMPAPGPRYQ